MKELKEYYLQQYNNSLPICKGCFNEHGTCGTPCTTCDKYEDWNLRWKIYLYIEEEFIVWKEKSKAEMVAEKL